jgi:predicted DNA-binding protein
MSDVVSVRVPKELKKKMKKFNIDWSSEIRRFIEERVKELELLELIDEVEEKAKKRKTRVDFVKLIKESREEHDSA